MSDINSSIPSFLQPLPRSVQKVKLPSRGILYKEGPASTGCLNLAAMTLVEENLLNSGVFSGSDDPITAVLKKCLQEHIDPAFLLSADKYFLFMMLRAVTYGSEYTFNWTCTAVSRRNRRGMCGFKNTETVLIPDQFKMKYLSDTDKEPFTIILPDSGKTISFRLSRSNDEKDIDQYASKLEKEINQGVNRGYTAETYQLAKLITHVENNEITKDIKLDVIMQWLSSLSAKDLSFYREKLNYYTPGLDTSVSLTCASCDTTHEMDLPLTQEFFRPKLTNDSRPVGDEVRSDVLSSHELPSNIPNPSGGTPLVLREIERSEDRRDGIREDQAGNDTESIEPIRNQAARNRFIKRLSSG
jgi:hypothetical protein